MISNVYQYYLKTYASKPPSRFDSHKKSDLRKVYNSMVNLNKNSPLYKVDLSQDIQRFAIDLKEGAREFKNTVLDISSLKDEGRAFLRKTAYSSNESLVKAEYVGGDQLYIDEDKTFEISVKQLATPQISTGDFLPSNSLALTPGQYSFDIVVGDTSYEFQYRVNEKTTNLQLQNRLSLLINQSNIGVRAEVIRDSNGSSALELVSTKTGVSEFRPYTFKISGSNTSKLTGSIEYFGLNNVSTKPSNALFTSNGVETSSHSNSFILENSFAVTLEDISREDETATVGLLQSSDSILHNVQRLVDGFNDLYSIGKDRDNNTFFSNKFLKELNNITLRYKDSLQASGIILEVDGPLLVNEESLTYSVNNGSFDGESNRLSDFQSSLIRQMEQISLDPLEYINKTLISYPNPVRSYSNPYLTSIYAGMIFNGYL
mgnify:CR=1 FL=1